MGEYFGELISKKLVWAIFVLGVGIIGQFVWKWRRYYDLASKLSGPKSWPLIGNGLLFLGRSSDLFDKINNLILSHESPFRVWLGSYLYVILTKAEDIEKILSDSKEIFKDPIMRFGEPYFGQGLITGSGPGWKLHRKMIQPTFNMKILEKYTETFNDKAAILTEKINETIGDKGTTIDILHYLNLCTIDILCATIMGKEMDAQNNQNEEFVHSAELMYKVLYERMLKIWLHPNLIHRFTQNYRDTQHTTKIIDEFIYSIIDQKKIEFDKRTQEEQLNHKYVTTLEQLLLVNKNGEYFNKKEMKDEIFTLFAAGQDTSATIAAFTILMLAIHPEIQKKVYEEIVEVLDQNALKDFKEPVPWEYYPKLKYLDMVIKETLRLFPIGPLMVRQLRGELKVNNYTLPAGCGVVISMFHTHRSEQYWDNPQRFDPDRFLPEKVEKRHPYAYIPFSSGLRKCLGQKYSTLCLQTLLVHLVRRFEFTSDIKYENFKVTADISVRSVLGYQVQVQKRL